MLKNKIAEAPNHPFVRWAIGVALFVIIAEILVLYIPPAWAAVAIPITDKITVNLGELPQWIISLVAAGGLWKAWRAEKAAAKSVAKIEAVSLQIDGLLTERDRAKVLEGEVKGEKSGALVAESLAEGQRQGREAERESVAASSKTPAAGAASPVLDAQGKPIAVADDRTAIAGERVAEATERVAKATEKKK